MTRPTNQHLENQFDGMSRKSLAAHAREQIRIYSEASDYMSDTRRALLRDAWEFVLRKKTARCNQPTRNDIIAATTTRKRSE